MANTMHRQWIAAVLLWCGAVSSGLAAPAAIEIGPKNTADLPGGREADGIIGDFVLRNDRIEAVISGNQHNRKANMVVNWGAPTPGCLYDLTIRGADNDQLTWFGPGRQEGQLSSVRVIETGGEGGRALVRAELTPAAGGGVGRTHDYILRDGWQSLLVVSSYTNASDKPVKVRPTPAWTGLRLGFATDGITTALCQDPADRVGYAFGPGDWPGAQLMVNEVEIPAGGSVRFAVAVAVGRGALDAYGLVAAAAGKEVSRFRGRIVDTNGQPAPDATLHVAKGDKTLVGYVDKNGAFDFSYPQNSCRVTVKDLGRAEVKADLVADTDHRIEVPLASGVHVTVTDDDNRPLPCKTQFIGIEGTPTPHLGRVIRAHGCDNQYHSENGRFAQALPPGKYRVVITRGIEYDHVEKVVEVPEGESVTIAASLKRMVDTTGWISTDFHNHTTISGDNYCGTDDRIINLAAEHVEFAPATEHNRIYDWKPHIDRLGLSEQVATVTGIKLTGGGPHLNAFPLKSFPYRQDNGAPQWDPDPRINALQLRRLPGDKGARWVHLNHPSVARYFKHLDRNCRPADGFPQLESFIDGAELWGESILSGEQAYEREWQGRTYTRESWPFAWMQMMNAGTRIWTIAVSDAHEVMQGVGGWRTYVLSGEDQPAKIDPREIIANAKAGHSFVTSGPFLEVTTADGHLPGETIVTDEPVTLKVRVQCNTWVDVDRVAVLVSGRVDPKLDFKRSDQPEMFRDGAVRFVKDIDVTLEEDAYLIVAAVGENSTLATGYGRSWQKDLHPTAYHNPIFVDVDGDGFEPNGDLLGHPFLKNVRR